MTSKASPSFFRPDGRSASQLRSLGLQPGFVQTAEGSVLVSMGNTRVLTCATIEQGVPGWLRNSGRGWVTAEYSMLPRSTVTRTPRESDCSRFRRRQWRGSGRKSTRNCQPASEPSAWRRAARWCSRVKCAR